MATSEFLPWANAPGAPVESQAAYAAEAPNGRGPGLVPKESYNKALRQATAMSAAMGAFIVAEGGNALDDGNTTELRDAIIAAINHLVGASPLAPISGQVQNGDISVLALTLNLALPAGTWLIDADAAIFCSAYPVMNLLIDGTVIQSYPNLGDPDGTAIIPMGGFRTITLTTGRNVPIAFTQQAGGTSSPFMIKAIAYKIA